MTAHASARITIAEYLQIEQRSAVKHEFAAGLVFAMAGASERHNRIAGNVFAQLHSACRSNRCMPFMSDMRVKIDQVVYYPDVMVVCDPNDTDPYLKAAPCLIVEVLSESTERIDRGEKLYNYRQIPALTAYMLISQDALRVDVYRQQNRQWLLESYAEITDTISLACPDSRFSLADIYERIVF
jgi:Uma2 family endonuclease